MALAYSDIQIEIREISLKNRPEELYHVSKKGTVPVLVTSDNLVIDESLEIMLWALKNNLKQTWLVKIHKSEMDMINQNDTIFKKWLDKYKYHDKYPENPKEYYRDQCNNILFNYNKTLGKSKYLLSNDISIVDIAIFPFVRQFSNIEYQWFKTHYNHLELWLKTISSSNLFNSIMRKYDTWNNENEGVLVDFNS